MARGRMLSRSISEDPRVRVLCEEIGGDAALFFTWLIPHLDVEGRQVGDPDALKAKVVPRYSGVTPDLVRTTVVLAAELGLLVWYRDAFDSYIQLHGFKKNQTGLRADKEAPSQYPSPENTDAIQILAGNPEGVPTYSGPSPDLLPTKVVRREEKRREVKEKRKEKKVEPQSSEKPNTPDPPAPARAKLSPAVSQVQEKYLEYFPKREKQAQSAKIVKKIRARLDEGYTSEELCEAIDGNQASEFHRDNGHDSLELILRDAAHVDQFRAKLSQGPPSAKVHRLDQQAADLLNWSAANEQPPPKALEARFDNG